MLTPTQIRNMEFQKTSIGGYKPLDVDCFLEELATTIESLYKENNEMLEKLNVLANKIEEYRKDEDSIHTALLNAQRMADKVVKEAKEQAEMLQSSAQKRADETVAAANAKSEATINKATKNAEELTRTTRKNADRLTAETKEKTDRMVSAAVDSVSRQQQAFNKLKTEVSSFRSNLLTRYKTHVEMITLIPNEVTNDPTVASEKSREEFEAKKAEIMKDSDMAAQTDELDEIGASEPETDEDYDIDEPDTLDDIPEDEEDFDGGSEQPAEEEAPEEEKHPVRQEGKKAFRVVVEEDEDDPQTESGLKFGGDYGSKSDRQDEAAGFGFFKKRSK